jgi:hypothetical protein
MFSFCIEILLRSHVYLSIFAQKANSNGHTYSTYDFFILKMTTGKSINLILIIFVLSINLETSGQKSYLYDLLPNELQSGTISNPASMLKTHGREISIFPFSNFHFDVYTPFSANEIFNRSTHQSYFSDQANKDNRSHKLLGQGSFEWFYFSGKINDSYWRLSFQEQTVGGACFENNFLKLLNNGNTAFVGRELRMHVSAGWQHLRSLNFTWAMPLSEKLNAGINIKFYTGRSLFTARTDLSVYTHPTIEHIDLGFQGKGKTSVPITLGQITGSDQLGSSLMNYLFGIRNPGLGFDLGATYQISPKINLSASINDLGFVYWNRNTTSFITNESYRWKGIDISEPIDIEVFDNIKESLTMTSFRDSFLNGLIVPNNSPFFTAAPISVNGGASYNFDKRFSFLAFTQFYVFANYTKFNLGTLATFSFLNRVNMFAGLSASNYSGISLPAGITYNGRRLNATFTAHHLFSMLFPGTGRNYGGSISLSYKIKPKTIVRTATY